MSSQIMTGNKKLVRIVVYALILCLLLAGCSGKIDSYEDDGTGNETISDIATDPTGTTGTTSAIIDEEETQSDIKPNANTMPDDEFASENSVPSTESPERLPDSSTATTTPANGDNVTSTTEPSTTPTDDTATTNPENGGNDMPDYGIELPDDNWD